MGVCQIEERDAGRSYPRTCPTCKLTGPCAKGLDRKAMAARIEALAAENSSLHSRIDALMRDDTLMRGKLAMAVEVCQTIDDVVKEGHDNLGEMVAHFLTAVDPARATIAAIKEGGE